MNNSKRFCMVACISLALSALAIGCGDDNDGADTAFNDPNASTGLGNFNFDCGGESGSSQQQQQKQIPFQQQQQQGCGKQKFTFKEAKVDDFSVKLDCDSRQVTVAAKGQGQQQQQQQTLPIQQNGTVKGKLSYPQQMQSDNRGNQVCWVQYEVDFNGKAECKEQGDDSDKKLAIQTQVQMTKVTDQQLQEAGISGGDNTPSPSPSPSVSPSPSPSASPSPSPSPSPSASPSPTGTPVVICVVEDPCPVVGSTEVSCPGDDN